MWQGEVTMAKLNVAEVIRELGVSNLKRLLMFCIKKLLVKMIISV